MAGSVCTDGISLGPKLSPLNRNEATDGIRMIMNELDIGPAGSRAMG